MRSLLPYMHGKGYSLCTGLTLIRDVDRSSDYDGSSVSTMDDVL